jgi:putative transposase
MCRVLGVSESGYYAWLKRPKSETEKRREELTAEIKKIFLESGKRYGYPKITRKLHQKGYDVCEKTVYRIMKEEGLKSIITKKYKKTTDSNHSYKLFPNLLNRNFTVDKPGKAWVTDITYIWTGQGWLYLASVLDLYSRKIIGWDIQPTMSKQLTLTALKRALNYRKPEKGAIHHSDRGSQYAATEYQGLVKESRMRPSMSRKGNCYDNACIESFHGIIKRELVYPSVFKTREEARIKIFDYIVNFYNAERIHSANGYVSPSERERAYKVSYKSTPA